MLVLGLVVALVLTRGGAAPSTGTSAAVILEPTAVEVPNPFTDSVAVDERPLSPSDVTTPSDDPAATAGAGGVVVTASAPGLYGGTRDRQACDLEMLVTFLQADSTKAEAWARAHGIAVGAIADFVDGLTPVVLRRDTRVTDHGYLDGRALAHPAVLQAGTAILVDDYAEPRVKCSSGSPLSAAQPVTTETRYDGTRWAGFDPAAVVVVKPTVKVPVLVLVDTRSGSPFGRPVGTTGSLGLTRVAAIADPATATPTTSAPATETPGPTTPEGTNGDILADINSIASVSNGPPNASVVTLPAGRVTAIRTYHWNGGNGASPGTIRLKGADGAVYGPFSTTGSDGQGGVPNAYWTAITNIRLPAGSYTVIDSDPDTWAWAADTGGQGIVTVWGVPEVGPTATSTDDAFRGPDAIAAVQARFCLEGVTEYVQKMVARKMDSGLYRVEVTVSYTSGSSWIGSFDVDLSGASDQVVHPLDDKSGRLVC